MRSALAKAPPISWALFTKVWSSLAFFRLIAIAIVTNQVFGFSETIGSDRERRILYRLEPLYLRRSWPGHHRPDRLDHRVLHRHGFPSGQVGGESSESGHGTNVIQGLAVSMEATALPALVIVIGIIITYNLAGLYGIATAVTTMLALAGMIVAPRRLWSGYG